MAGKFCQNKWDEREGIDAYYPRFGRRVRVTAGYNGSTRERARRAVFIAPSTFLTGRSIGISESSREVRLDFRRTLPSS